MELASCLIKLFLAGSFILKLQGEVPELLVQEHLAATRIQKEHRVHEKIIVERKARERAAEEITAVRGEFKVTFQNIGSMAARSRPPLAGDRETKKATT